MLLRLVQTELIQRQLTDPAVYLPQHVSILLATGILKTAPKLRIVHVLGEIEHFRNDVRIVFAGGHPCLKLPRLFGIEGR